MFRNLGPMGCRDVFQKINDQIEVAAGGISRFFISVQMYFGRCLICFCLSFILLHSVTSNIFCTA